jgi:adenine/guanine phosphoribosyltransferase-like PRPP-binding protein
MHASYLELEPETREASLAWAMGEIESHHLEFDTVVGTGVSGVTFGAILAHQLRKPLTVIRKGDDLSSHSTKWVPNSATPGVSGHFEPRVVESVFEDTQLGVRYVVVDDLMASGETLSRVHTQMKGQHHVATLLYREHLVVMGEG